MVDTGNEREGWKAWNERLAERHNEPVLGDVPVNQEHVADWAEGLDIPVGGETILFVDCEEAFYRTSYTRAFAQLLQRAGVEFGLMREQWCCGGPAAEMGYVEFAAGTPTTTSPIGARWGPSGSSLPTRTTSRSRRTTRAATATSTTSRSSSASSWSTNWSRRAASSSPEPSSAPSPTTTRAGSTSARASTRRRGTGGRCRASRSTTSTTSRSGPTARVGAVACRWRSRRSPRRSAAGASRAHRSWRSTRDDRCRVCRRSLRRASRSPGKHGEPDLHPPVTGAVLTARLDRDDVAGALRCHGLEFFEGLDQRAAREGRR